MISNSLDIDFIHGDVHGRSCKKTYNFDGLVQERRNSSALAMELRISCTILSI